MNSFSISDMYILMIGSKGTLLGAGYNDSGQLGTLAEETPFLKKIPFTEPLSQIKTGYKSSFLITRDKKLFALGLNSHGKLGLGHIRNVHEAYEVKGVNEPVACVVTGCSHTLVLTNNGKVYGAGNNSYNQLGLPKTTGESHIFIEIPLSTEKQVRAKLIAGGAYHTIALTTENELYAWGINYWGHLGLGHAEDIERPTQVPLESLGGKKIIDVKAGSSFSALLTETGQVYCCGNLTFKKFQEFKLVKGLNKVKALAVGDRHILALTHDGKVFAWGKNEYKQISISAGQIVVLPRLIATKAVAISGLNNSSFILTKENNPLLAQFDSYQLKCLGEKINVFFGNKEIPGLKFSMIQQAEQVKKPLINWAQFQKLSIFADISITKNEDESYLNLHSLHVKK